jgi:dihydroorotate dehydrogenase
MHTLACMKQQRPMTNVSSHVPGESKQKQDKMHTLACMYQIEERLMINVSSPHAWW